MPNRQRPTEPETAAAAAARAIRAAWLDDDLENTVGVLRRWMNTGNDVSDLFGALVGIGGVLAQALERSVPGVVGDFLDGIAVSADVEASLPEDLRRWLDD